MASKPILGYWKIRGLGHPVRLLLKYLEVDFEDKYYECQVTKEDWYVDRAKLNLDFPNLPYLVDGSNKVTEMRAIMKYLCRTRKPELLGETVEVQTKLDMLDYFIYDFWYLDFGTMAYEYTEQLHKKYKETELVKLGYLSDFMKDNKWFTGNDITYMDVLLYEVFYQFKVFDANCLEKFKNLQEFMTRFEELPAIKEYINSPTFLKGPVYTELSVYKF